MERPQSYSDLLSVMRLPSLPAGIPRRGKLALLEAICTSEQYRESDGFLSVNKPGIGVGHAYSVRVSGMDLMVAVIRQDAGEGLARADRRRTAQPHLHRQGQRPAPRVGSSPRLDPQGGSGRASGPTGRCCATVCRRRLLRCPLRGIFSTEG